jgi:hypothetical protein
VTLSERYDQYSDFGSAAKPKFAIRYKPFNDLTFRATYSEGFSAPSLADLFGTPIPAETTVNDPKTGATGVPVVNFVSGNPRLKPETVYSYYVAPSGVPDRATRITAGGDGLTAFRPMPTGTKSPNTTLSGTLLLKNWLISRQFSWRGSSKSCWNDYSGQRALPKHRRSSD